MTPRRQLRNAAASVHARLLTLARRHRWDFNLLLLRFTIERFLYRLSISEEVDRFTLKGATLFRVWDEHDARPTRDVDFLAFGPDDHAAIRLAVENVCRADCPEDGVRFDPATIQVADIRQGQPYRGLRARIRGNLGRTRLHLQVDIGFGDTIIPERKVQDYPTVLDLPAPRIWTYPRETVVAEKLHAMVEHGARNTRVKDLWDLARLARRFPFDGEVLRTAITETFRRRGTSFGGERPVALLPSYYEEAMRERLWQELRRGMEDDADGPARLVDAGVELLRFLGPILDSLIESSSFTQAWPAGGPWGSGIQARMGGEGSG